MLLRSTRAQDKFYIDWWLMNHCSWHCSYCHDVLRAGNIALPYIKDCRRFVDQAQAHAQQLNKTAQIKFTGGEVTEWADFDQLLSYAHNQGCETQFRTNANISRARWIGLMKHTDLVSMGYHPGHTQTSQFLLAIANARKLGVTVMVEVNMMPEVFDELEALIATINRRWPEVSVNRAMRFQDPVSNTKPLEYTPIQQLKLMRQHGDLEWVSDSGSEFTDYQTLVLEERNKFKGWHCSAGVEQCVVDASGRVYRAHCRTNGFMGYLSDEQLVWNEEPMICANERCVNSFDILATKSLS